VAPSPKLANTVIAGVNKAGTTGLYVALASHPEVAASAVKETRFFLPLRYGEPTPPLSEYESCFAAAGDEPVRIEATPAYFYGGRPLAQGMRDVLGDARILLSFREPVSRFVSFFTYQKARMRIPEEMTIAEYLAACDRLAPDDFSDPANERYLGLLGGCYADFLPAWTEVFGDGVHLVFFDDIVADLDGVLRDLAAWLRIDPDGYQVDSLDSENRTVVYRNRAFQRIALFVNDSAERFLRRHHGLKQRLRAAYYRLNGQARREEVPDEIRNELQARYQEPNARLVQLLRGTGIEMPSWLVESTPVKG
jgi:hypothetical protein